MRWDVRLYELQLTESVPLTNGNFSVTIFFRVLLQFSEYYLTSVGPQMVDFGPEQGLSDFETGGVAGYVEDLKRAKTPLRAKRCRLWMGTN